MWYIFCKFETVVAISYHIQCNTVSDRTIHIMEIVYYWVLSTPLYLVRGAPSALILH